MGEKIRSTKVIQSRETSTRILNQAMKFFSRNGYHGTTIDDICRAAGVTKGSMYWHFKSKEDLLKKITDEFEKQFLDGLINTVKEVNAKSFDKFDKMLRYVVAFAYYNRELCVSFIKLSAELVGGDHRIETRIKRIYKKYQKFLSDLIRQGRKENAIKKDFDVDLAALAIISFHDGILLQWSMNRDKIDGKAFASTYKKIVLDGLRA